MSPNPLILVLLLAITCLAAPARSQGPQADPAGNGIWTLRGVADLPAATRLELADAAEPIWVEVSRTGETLADLLMSTCGKQPAEVDTALRQQAVAVNQVAGPDTRFSAGNVVAIPFCLKVERNVPVTVAAGDSPTVLLDRAYGVYGNRTVQEFYALNADRPQYKTFEAFERYLRPGDELTLPYAAPTRVFAARPPADSDLQEIIARLPNESVRAQLLNSVQPATRGTINKPRLRYISSVEFESGDPDANCGGAPGELASVVSASELAERFSAEQAAKAVYWRADPAKATLASTTVGIIDSGLAIVGDDYFDERFFAANARELDRIAGVDDDNNNHVDDIYGSNFYGWSGEIRPIATDLDRPHGTKMAALILGGPSIAPNWTLSFKVPVVRLKVVNFSSAHPDFPTVSPAELPSAIVYLQQQGAQIVNMSMGIAKDVALIETTLRKQDQILYVVAAGNAKPKGNNLNGTPLYPARFGGRDLSNVITVGAHDLAGKRASFSNYSPDYVDLLAPGCAVQTRTDEGELVSENGTSPATAIVSFTAGLLHALGLTKTVEIKQRLLFASDYDITLAGDAYSSSRLNIVKAISLYHDVVEFADPSSKPIYAVLTDTDSLLAACEELAAPAAPERLRKLVFNLGSSDSKRLEYWIELDDKIEKLACSQKSENVEIGTLKIAGEATRVLRSDDLKEVVLGNFVNR